MCWMHPVASTCRRIFHLTKKRKGPTTWDEVRDCGTYPLVDGGMGKAEEEGPNLSVLMRDT